MISAIAAVETGFQSKQREGITRFLLCWLESRKSGLTRRAAGAAMIRGEGAPDVSAADVARMRARFTVPAAF